MTDSADQWYVELSLGPILGPMNREDLEALAHSRGILASDRIRQGHLEPWQTACEIRGLFPDESHQSGSVPDSCLTEEHGSRQCAGDGQHHAEPDHDRPDGKAELPITGMPTGPARTESVEPPQDSGSSIQLPPAVSETGDLLESSFVSDTCEPKVPATPLSSQVDGGTPPLRIKPVRAELPPRPAGTHASVSVVPEFSHSTQLSNPPAAIQNPAASSLILQLRRQPLKLVAGLILIMSITTAALFSAATGLRSYRESEIYGRLSDIFEQWQRHKSGKASAPWHDFVTRSRAEIDDTLPWLEEHAEPGDRNHALLLFASRDLRSVLDHPPGKEVACAKRLNGFFKQLSVVYTDTDSR